MDIGVCGIAGSNFWREHSIPNLRWRKFFLIFLRSGRKSKTKRVDLTVDIYGFRVYNESIVIYGFRIRGGAR